MIKGPCYPASEAVYHMMGGKNAGLTPMVIKHEGISHWYLRWDTPKGIVYIDPTVSQFDTIPEYSKGKGCGFLTTQISKRGSEYLADF